MSNQKPGSWIGRRKKSVIGSLQRAILEISSDGISALEGGSIKGLRNQVTHHLVQIHDSFLQISTGFGITFEGEK